VRAVVHAAKILRTLGEAERPLGLTEIAREVGLSKASAFNILTTLRIQGLVSQDRDTSRYRLGWGLMELGARVVDSDTLVVAAKEHLAELARRTGEAAFLAVLDRKEAFYVQVAESPSPLRAVTSVGARNPLHATSSGKVLLAWLDEATALRHLDPPLERFNEHTVTSVDELMAELARVRELGFATCWEELNSGVSGLAMPIRIGDGPPRIALSIAAPSSRINAENFETILPDMQQAVDDIVRELRGRA